MFTICFECFLVNVSRRLIFTIISTLWRPECTKDIKARSCAPSPEVRIRLNDEDFNPVSPGWLCTGLQLGSAIQRKCRKIKQPWIEWNCQWISGGTTWRVRLKKIIARTKLIGYYNTWISRYHRARKSQITLTVVWGNWSLTLISYLLKLLSLKAGFALYILVTYLI